MTTCEDLVMAAGGMPKNDLSSELDSLKNLQARQSLAIFAIVWPLNDLTSMAIMSFNKEAFLIMPAFKMVSPLDPCKSVPCPISTTTVLEEAVEV